MTATGTPDNGVSDIRHPSAREFVTPVGVFPIETITPAMLRVFDTVDDDGWVSGSAQTIRRMVELDLLKRNPFCSVRATMTHAGWNAHALFGLKPQHRTSTCDSGADYINGNPVESRPAGWSCTCGAGGPAADREEARAAARRHRAHAAASARTGAPEPNESTR